MSIFLTVWRIFWPDLMNFSQNMKFEVPIFKGVTRLYRAQINDIVDLMDEFFTRTEFKLEKDIFYLNL